MMNVKRRRFFAVEWTAAFVAAAGAAQLYMLPHHGHDVRAGADVVNQFVGDESHWVW